jgi:hypothetical protein
MGLVSFCLPLKLSIKAQLVSLRESREFSFPGKLTGNESKERINERMKGENFRKRETKLRTEQKKKHGKTLKLIP